VTASDKVLVVGPSWVGDMVMAQALYRLLRQRNPTVEIDVVAPTWSLPVLARMPEVAHGIELAVAHGDLAFGRRRKLALELRSRGYSRAIVLPRSAKAALVPWLARIPRRTGFRGEYRYGLINDMRRFDDELDQTVKRFIALGHERGEPLPPSLPAALRPSLAIDAANLERLRAAHGLPESVPLVALMPGAEYGPAKRWPYFVELSSRLSLPVAILGSAGEREACAGIVGKNLAGETTLDEAIDLISCAEFVVTNDSGLMHVAAALGTPQVALFGSSSPRHTPPLSAHARVLWLGIECSPCYARECPLGHFRCMRELSVDRVLDEIASMKTTA